MQRRQARLDKRNGWLSQRGRHLYRLYDAGVSGQVYAVYWEDMKRTSKCALSVATCR